jgi:hypothetical protein
MYTRCFQLDTDSLRPEVTGGRPAPYNKKAHQPAQVTRRTTVQLPIKIMEIQGQTLNYLNFWPIFEAEGIIIL